MALGATQGNVLLAVLSRTLRLTLVGIVAGTIGAFAAGRLISSLLFETQPTDPSTFAAMAGLLCMVAPIAGGGSLVRAPEALDLSESRGMVGFSLDRLTRHKRPRLCPAFLLRPTGAYGLPLGKRLLVLAHFSLDKQNGIG